jgi:hypothetical protein
MLIQVRGVLVHVMSGTELSRVRTEFRLRLPEPINKSPLESRGPTLLCNQVKFCFKCMVTRLTRRAVSVSYLSRRDTRQNPSCS